MLISGAEISAKPSCGSRHLGSSPSRRLQLAQIRMLRGQSVATRRATRSRTALIDKTSAANAVPAAEPSSTKPAGRDQDKPDEFVEGLCGRAEVEA